MAQTPGVEKGSLWLATTVGFTYNQDDLARINEQIDVFQEIENSVKIRFNPSLNFAVFDSFLVGAHLGYGYQYAQDIQSGQDLNFRNYKFGVQARYYVVKLIEGIYLQSELGANYNFYNGTTSVADYSDRETSYFKSYFNAGVSFFPSEKFEVGLIFKDLFTYHSSGINFDQRSGFSGSKVFSEFINFPHFIFSYRIN